MSIPIFIAAILSATATILGLLSQTFIWQVKEYRWDRMKSRLTSPEGSPWKYPLYITSLFFLATSLFFLAGYPVLVGLVSWVSLLALVIHHAVRIQRAGILRPDMTQKATLVLILAAAMVFGGYVIGGMTPLSLRVFAYVLVAHAVLPVMSICVALVNIPAGYKKRSVIKRATALRASLDLSVVGITGSVGKTSTKFFLEQILKHTNKSFRATIEHRNAEYPVAQDMLEQLDDTVDVYVAEMGAYRSDEIELLGQLAKPTVGIITHIGNQHIALFGNKEKIRDAKWELIEALPDTGVAVLNADDPLLQEKAKQHIGKIVWFSVTQKADIYVDAVSFEQMHTKAVLHVGERKYDVSLPLVSRGLLASAVAAVAGAHALGVDADVIARALGKLVPYPRTMEMRKGKHNATVIDDSYSASEDAILNALEHIQRFPQKDKRIVLVPVIELGTEGPQVHRRIAKALASSGAQIYLFGDAYQKEFAQELRQATWQQFSDAKELARTVSKDLTDNSVILLEGRIPAVVREAV